MSLKNVRKLLNDTNDIKSLEDDEADETPIAKSRRNKKPLASLLLLEADDEVDTRDDDDGIEIQSDDEDMVTDMKRTNGTKQKMSKKKKRQVNKYADDDSDHEPSDEEDIEATIEEVNRILGAPDNVSASNGLKGSKSMDLLRVINRNLNFEEEFRSIKEAEMLSTAMTESKNIPGHLEGSNSIRDPRTGRVRLQPNKHRTGLTAKNWLLINPKRHLTINNPGVSMVIDESIKRDRKNHGNVKKREEHFVVKYSVEYQRIQNELLDLIKRSDTKEIINLMNENPNHVESLINASTLIAREDTNLSFELIQRALLVYENILPIQFNPTAKDCLLNYKRPENRPLFVTLFKFMVLCGRFKCYKTGLEVAKLILSFDPVTDPLSVLLIVDHLAIQAKNFDFLIQFYRNGSGLKVANLDKLPNFIFNTALALLLKSLDKAPKMTDANNIPKAEVSKVTSSERQSLFNESNELLQEGLILFPSVLRPFLDAMGVDPDASVKRCPYFYVDRTVDCPRDQSPFMHDIVEIFIERNAAFWKSSPDILLWLETNVNIVIGRLNADTDIVSKYQERRYAIYPIEKITPKNVFRHVHLSGLKKVKVPKDVLSPPSASSGPVGVPEVLAFDPIPPSDSFEYETEVVVEEETVGARGTSDGAIGVLSSFVQSWLPSFNPNPPTAPRTVIIVPKRETVNQRRAREPGVKDAREVRREPVRNEEQASSSVASVVTAVKELLNGFSIGDDGGDDGGE